MLGPSPLVPPWFEVPLRVDTEEFVLVPLTWNGFHHDFESYMSSVEHLQSTFDLDAVNPFVVDGARWPANTSLELAFIDAAWQQFESEVIRSSFCYCVKDIQESRQLGCGYIFHSDKSGYEVECHTWVRADMLESGFDETFYSWFRNWVENEWPFSAMTVVWPGRDISWNDWNSLPNEREWHG
jgi:hypothetical protein